MTRRFSSAEVTSLVGAITVLSVMLPAPQALLTAAGLSMVFVIPGFALTNGFLPAISAPEERLLASVGLSLVIATGAAVLLAATRIGLTRESFDVTLGVASIGLSIIGSAVQHARLSTRSGNA